MSLHIPSDISNIILEYYAQLKDLKWVPFVEPKTGKLKWKVNKYSAKYDNINKLLEFRKNNLLKDISFDIDIVRNGETIDRYNTIGTCIYLKKIHFVNKHKAIVLITQLYIEYIDEDNFKHSLFCSIYGRSILCRFDYDVYQDGNIHSTLIDFYIFNKNAYSLVIQKY
jgi:hypothetical protein